MNICTPDSKPGKENITEHIHYLSHKQSSLFHQTLTLILSIMCNTQVSYITSPRQLHLSNSVNLNHTNEWNQFIRTEASTEICKLWSCILPLSIPFPEEENSISICFYLWNTYLLHQSPGPPVWIRSNRGVPRPKELGSLRGQSFYSQEVMAGYFWAEWIVRKIK